MAFEGLGGVSEAHGGPRKAFPVFGQKLEVPSRTSRSHSKTRTQPPCAPEKLWMQVHQSSSGSQNLHYLISHRIQYPQEFQEQNLHNDKGLLAFAYSCVCIPEAYSAGAEQMSYMTNVFAVKEE